MFFNRQMQLKMYSSVNLKWTKAKTKRIWKKRRKDFRLWTRFFEDTWHEKKCFFMFRQKANAVPLNEYGNKSKSTPNTQNKSKIWKNNHTNFLKNLKGFPNPKILHTCIFYWCFIMVLPKFQSYLINIYTCIIQPLTHAFIIHAAFKNFDRQISLHT